MAYAIKQPTFLSKFSCLGDACEDTCCKGWGMQVDAATVQRYEKAAPELLEAVTGSGDSCLMKRDALTDHCVKYENGLCGIHRKHGTDFLGDACHFYPRMTRGLGDMRVMTGALSCPEVVRLSLFDDEAFTWQDATSERLPYTLIDYLPEGLTPEQVFFIHNAFVTKALSKNHSAARNLMHIFCVAESLQNIPVQAWPDAVPFYLEHADGRLPAPVAADSDPFFLLQALCGIIAAAKKGQQERLMQNVRMMEAALHVNIQWDNLAIAHLPDSMHMAASLEHNWNETWSASLDDVLKRYLASQIVLALFPFSGFGDTLANRAAIIAVRFATIKLALMSACRINGTIPTPEHITRIVQPLSRLLDHLAGADFSLSIYKETGWLNGDRLRALVGDRAA